VTAEARYAPKRIQLRRTRGWRRPDSAVVVSRPSKWGNPYQSGDAVALYRDFIERCSRSTGDPILQHDGLGVWDRDIKANIRSALAGKDLACWCPLDQPCHADVLLEIANEVQSGEGTK
jgi:uncharacterized protein DUF4326